MQDRALLVFVVMFVAVYALRLAMMAELRRWPAEQRARLIDAFYRQNKITSLVLIGAMALMLVPTLFGSRSTAFALIMVILAALLATVGGAHGNLKLRRLGFPVRYVRLHALLVMIMSAGMVSFMLLL